MGRITLRTRAAGIALAAFAFLPSTASAHAPCAIPTTARHALEQRARGEVRPKVTYQRWKRRLNQLQTAWCTASATRSHRSIWSGTAGASWYGPGFWNHTTSSGHPLTYGDGSIANRTMPFGTTCQLAFHGRSARGTVRDRGPFVAGRDFDLEQSLADQIGLTGAGVGVVAYVCRAP